MTLSSRGGVPFDRAQGNKTSTCVESSMTHRSPMLRQPTLVMHIATEGRQGPVDLWKTNTTRCVTGARLWLKQIMLLLMCSLCQINAIGDALTFLHFNKYHMWNVYRPDIVSCGTRISWFGIVLSICWWKWCSFKMAVSACEDASMLSRRRGAWQQPVISLSS